MELKSLYSEHIAPTYSRFDLELSHGEGSIVYDTAGKKYIDLGSGIAVNSFGFCDKVWQEAITKQLGTLQHTSNLYYTEPQAKLAEMLTTRTGLKKVFFSNSGAEANECAIKTARKYAADKYGKDRYHIITLKNSFHGRTIATLAATGQDSFHTDFGPFPEGFHYAEANNLQSVIDLVNAYPTAAIMIELIQGEGGVLVLDQDFVDGITALTAEKDILLIVDEVQTGNGRTGQLYAFQNYGIIPDVVSTAKGLAGGLPMGVTMFGEKTMDVLQSGTHGSTFGGNPICAAGAISILERIDDKFLSEVKAKSDYIKSELQNAPGVKSISGLGLMLGIETEKDAKQVVNECISKGVLVLTAKTKVRLLPALNIAKEDLIAAIQILKEVLKG